VQTAWSLQALSNIGEGAARLTIAVKHFHAHVGVTRDFGWITKRISEHTALEAALVPDPMEQTPRCPISRLVELVSVARTSCLCFEVFAESNGRKHATQKPNAL
jgi:hypothetical protein